MNTAIFAPGDALLRDFERNAQNFRWSSSLVHQQRHWNKTEGKEKIEGVMQQYTTAYSGIIWWSLRIVIKWNSTNWWWSERRVPFPPSIWYNKRQQRGPSIANGRRHCPGLRISCWDAGVVPVQAPWTVADGEPECCGAKAPRTGRRK